MNNQECNDGYYKALRHYLGSMGSRMVEFNGIAKKISMEMMAFRFDFLDEENPRRKAYQQLSDAWDQVQKAQESLYLLALQACEENNLLPKEECEHEKTKEKR